MKRKATLSKPSRNAQTSNNERGRRKPEKTSKPIRAIVQRNRKTLDRRFDALAIPGILSKIGSMAANELLGDIGKLQQNPSRIDVCRLLTQIVNRALIERYVSLSRKYASDS